MIFTTASFKGGVAKTVSAVHLAAILNDAGASMLVDGDENRSAMKWSQRGPGFGFPVIPPIQVPKYSGTHYEHVIFDTGQRPRDMELEANAAECDLLIVPTKVEAIDGDVLVTMIESLSSMKAENFKVLFTCVPPSLVADVSAMRNELIAVGIPVFESYIPATLSVNKAAATGVLLRDIKNEYAQRAWQAYVEVGKELLA